MTSNVTPNQWMYILYIILVFYCIVYSTVAHLVTVSVTVFFNIQF